jgi:hypothetical protein
MYFGGNIETAIRFVRSAGLMPCMLSKNRFNGRMHKIGGLPEASLPNTLSLPQTRMTWTDSGKCR